MNIAGRTGEDKEGAPLSAGMSYGQSERIFSDRNGSEGRPHRGGLDRKPSGVFPNLYSS